MVRIGLALAFALIAAGPTRAASPDPSLLAVPPAEMARARDLVRALGSDDYTEREEAQKALSKMGRMARPVLAEATFTNPSAEIRSRASRLLPRAEAEELKARLETFLADDDLEYEHELPGWAEFRVAAGAEWRLFGATLWKDARTLKTARTVYIDLLDSTENRNLVYRVGGSLSELGSAVGTRRVELYNARFPGRVVNSGPRTISPIDVITLLFAESQVSTRYIPTTRVISITILFNSVTFGGADDRSTVYRNVAAHWMETRDDSASQYQAMLVANTLGMPGPGTRVALRLLGDSKGLPMHRANAMVNLVRFDARDSVPALEKAMNDSSIVYSALGAMNAAQTYDPIQIRDVALVAAIVMSRQRPEDFGFLQRANYGGGTILNSYMQWAFPGGSWYTAFTHRAMAFAKWEAWREQNLGAEKGDTVK